MLTFYSCQMIRNDSWLQKPCTNRDVQLKDMLQKQSLEMCGSEVNCYFSYTLSPQVFISNLRTEVAVDKVYHSSTIKLSEEIIRYPSVLSCYRHDLVCSAPPLNLAFNFYGEIYHLLAASYLHNFPCLSC